MSTHFTDLKFCCVTDGDSNKSFLVLPSASVLEVDFEWLLLHLGARRPQPSLSSPRPSAFIHVSDFPPFMSPSLRSVTSEIIFLLNRSICSLSLPLPQPLAAFSTSFFSHKDLSASTHSRVAVLYMLLHINPTSQASEGFTIRQIRTAKMLRRDKTLNHNSEAQSVHAVRSRRPDSGRWMFAPHQTDCKHGADGFKAATWQSR